VRQLPTDHDYAARPANIRLINRRKSYLDRYPLYLERQTTYATQNQNHRINEGLTVHSISGACPSKILFEPQKDLKRTALVCEFAGMAKVYRAYLPEQDLLLPQNMRDWLPEDHLAHFVSDVVDQLDLWAIESAYEEGRGQPPYHPRMMTKILLYGYCVGVFASRRIQTKLLEDVGFRMLAAGNAPDFRTISDFRKLHLTALQGMFGQVLEIALKMGALKLGRVVLDGSKVKANASKHKAMSYGRIAWMVQ
jgi:transposase